MDADCSAVADELKFKGDLSELEDMFTQMDTNHDGMIDWDEFVTYLGSSSTVGGAIADNIRRSLFTRFDQAFDIIPSL